MTWTAVGFGAYLAVLAVLAVRAGKTAGASEAEYFLAGRSLGPWVVALSAVASGRSAWLLLGMSGLAYGYGLSAVWFLPGYIAAELFLFAGLGRRLRRATGAQGDVTVGDYFASTFPAWARALQSVYGVLVTAYVSGQLVAGTKGITTAFGGGKTLGLWITGAVVLAYVVVGGFKAVSWTDAAQVGLMALALVVLPIVAVVELGGLGAVLDRLGPLADPLHKGGAFVLTGLAVGLGSPGNPHILVRYISVGDEGKLTRSALVGTTWNVAMGWGALWVGLCGRAMREGLADKETVFPLLAEAFLHPLLYGLVMAALLAAIMSTVDNQVLVVASAFTRDLRRAARRPMLADRSAARQARVVSAVEGLGPGRGEAGVARSDLALDQLRADRGLPAGAARRLGGFPIRRPRPVRTAVFGGGGRSITSMGTATHSRIRTAMSTTGITGIVAEIRAEIGACRLCKGMRPFRKQAPECFGTTATGYMLVGDAAGMGPRPFDDKTGQVLRRALDAVNDERFQDLEDLFFLSHAVRCIPPHPTDRAKTRAASRTECRTCRPYLEFEMRALRPRLIISLGAKAAEAVLGRPVKIEREHAKRHRLKDIEVLTLIAPSPYNRASLKRLDMTIESYTRWLTGLFGALIDDHLR